MNENPQLNLYIYTQLILNKGAEKFNGERTVFSTVGSRTHAKE